MYSIPIHCTVVLILPKATSDTEGPDELHPSFLLEIKPFTA
jgi:hypothetical protein